MNRKTVLLGATGFLLIGLTAFYLWYERKIEPKRETVTTPHFETSTPEDGVVLAGVPLNVTLDFNLDLVSGSSILIMQEGIDYGSSSTEIDENKLSMRRRLVSNAPNGNYTIKYRACWINNNCANGQYFFSIDRSLADSFTDYRSQDEVVIDMRTLAFLPEKMRIARGTKVTWKNSDTVNHYVNTDAHPSHTYHLNQNSRELPPGAEYTVVFDERGIYPYHCSAHASTMIGSLLVE